MTRRQFTRRLCTLTELIWTDFDIQGKVLMKLNVYLSGNYDGYFESVSNVCGYIRLSSDVTGPIINERG